MTKTTSIAFVVALAAMSALDPAWAREPVPVVMENAGAIAGQIAAAQGVQQPFGMHLACFTWSNNNICGASFTAPASSRLVIEFVTATCSVVPGSTFLASLATIVSPNGETIYGLQSQDRTQFQVVSQLVKIYADPGTEVQFFAQVVDQPPPTGGCNFALSGQQISVP